MRKRTAIDGQTSMTGFGDAKLPRRARPPDLAFDALVEVTQSMVEMERDKINVALRAIRAQCERDGLHPDSIPDEIRLRAAHYRTTFPGLTMTPTALAKHWIRVLPAAKPQGETLPQRVARLRAERRQA